MTRFTLAAAAMALTLPAAHAAAIPGAASVPSAVAAERPVLSVACWRFGWRGWGMYPGCFPPRAYAVAPYYVPAPVYAPPPVYVPPRRCWIRGAWRVC
jgi:hypothetical protein